MPIEKESPAASAKARGTKSKKDKRNSAPIIDDAQGTLQLSKTEKAAFIFAFLDRLKRDPEMKSLDALAALWFIQLVGDDLTFYMSAKHIAKLLRRKAESVGEDCIGRFRRGGYLIHILVDDADQDDKRGGSKPQGGRYANTYRLAIPDAVSPEKPGETGDQVSPEKSGKTERPKKGVSPEISGEVSPEKSGAITIEDTLEGGRAPGRAPAITSIEVILVEQEEERTQEQKRAGSALMGPTVASEAIPSASDITSAADLTIAADEYKYCVPDAMFGLDPDDGEDRPDDAVTLAELDRLAAEEAASDEAARVADAEGAEEWEAALDAAVDDLEMIWAGADVDLRRHAEDAVEGLAGEDADRADRFRADLEDLLDWAHPTCRATILLDHMEVIATFLSTTTGGRRHADEVVERFMQKFQPNIGGVSRG